MGIFILCVIVFCVGVVFGRAHEISKRIRHQIGYDLQNMQGKLDEATREGYQRAKLNVPYAMSLEETNLALHRIEGLAKGLVDDVTEMKRVMGHYGAEATENETDGLYRPNDAN